MAFDPSNFRFSKIIGEIENLKNNYDSKIKTAYEQAAKNAVESFKDFSDYTKHVDGTLFNQNNVLRKDFSEFSDTTSKTYNDISGRLDDLVNTVGNNGNDQDAGN